jgi:hypothetical protein
MLRGGSCGFSKLQKKKSRKRAYRPVDTNRLPSGSGRVTVSNVEGRPDTGYTDSVTAVFLSSSS